MTTWEIQFPDPRYLSQNDRLHWAQKARQTKAIRDSVHLLAKAQKIPACDQISVRLHYRPRVFRTIDGDTFAPTIKAAVDGLRDAGVVTDDDVSRVIHLTPKVHVPEKGQPARLWLLVEELP